MAEEPNMLEFANAQVAARLGALAFEVHRASQTQEAETIHDLRVAIRRFGQSLAVFSALLPKKESKKVRKQLRGIMDAAGAVRDRDIALEYLQDAGVSPQDPLWARISSERTLAERALVEKVRRWSQRNLSGKWRGALRLNI